jgi:hypothetical protein
VHNTQPWRFRAGQDAIELYADQGRKLRVPPGLGVVCRRTVQVQASQSMSAHRAPDTSPIRAAVHAAKMTTSPQPSK